MRDINNLKMFNSKSKNGFVELVGLINVLYHINKSTLSGECNNCIFRILFVLF